MTSNPSQAICSVHTHRPPPIYPAFTFSASPTYNIWVKLTCADLHSLRNEPAFAAQNIFFHLNHPIRYVCLVGTVVAHEKIYDRLHILTLDDGSGATVDIRVVHTPIPSTARVRDTLQSDNDDNTERHSNAPTSATTTTHPTSVPHVTLLSTPTDPIPLLHYTPPLSTSPSISHPHPHPLHPGTPIKAKGTLSLFRQTLQLDLKRLTPLPSTAAEARCWADTARFAADVLARPWVLGGAQLAALESGEKGRVDAERAQRAERAVRLRVRAERRARREERAERVRRREEREFDAGALDAGGGGGDGE